MKLEEVVTSLCEETPSKILLLVIDGLGGLPYPKETALEAAKTPNLDALAKESVCGLTLPIASGITPGSGPAHLALFGYSPLEYKIGRGVLEALGLGIELAPGDLAARANFATKTSQGIISDRRAGRLETEKNKYLCQLLQEKLRRLDEVEIFIHPGKEHRFVVIFRGEGLESDLEDADPQKNGFPQKFTSPLSKESQRSADVVNKFMREVDNLLKEFSPANTVLLRGFSKTPILKTFGELFKLTPAGIATYPMYQGLARLVGMTVLSPSDATLQGQVKCLEDNWEKFNFFYFHIKKTDSYGEDGNFKAKVEEIEKVDALIPKILKLKPEVLVVTSDHSTPCLLKAHSWHPNPFLLYSKYIQPDEVKCFSERACQKGGLGIFNALEVMPLILAQSGKLKKYGA
jgi:2,3-bisphosphoglycerate-independent phosphoglycerate mutase